MAQSKKAYIGVNVPGEWKPYLDEALENPEIQKELEIGKFSKTHSGLGSWIIRQFLVDKTSFHFQHHNTYEDYVTIIDNKIRRILDLYLKRIGEYEFEFWCEHCDSNDCEHIRFAVTVPGVMKPLEKRGLKYKGKLEN